MKLIKNVSSLIAEDNHTGYFAKTSNESYINSQVNSQQSLHIKINNKYRFLIQKAVEMLQIRFGEAST